MPNASRNTLIRNISPRSAALFGAGFLVSLGLLGVAAFILLNEGGLTGANNRIALGILVGNLVLLLGLAGVVVPTGLTGLGPSDTGPGGEGPTTPSTNRAPGFACQTGPSPGPVALLAGWLLLLGRRRLAR